MIILWDEVNQTHSIEIMTGNTLMIIKMVCRLLCQPYMLLGLYKIKINYPQINIDNQLIMLMIARSRPWVIIGFTITHCGFYLAIRPIGLQLWAVLHKSNGLGLHGHKRQ